MENHPSAAGFTEEEWTAVNVLQSWEDAVTLDGASNIA